MLRVRETMEMNRTKPRQCRALSFVGVPRWDIYMSSSMRTKECFGHRMRMFLLFNKRTYSVTVRFWLQVEEDQTGKAQEDTVTFGLMHVIITQVLCKAS